MLINELWRYNKNHEMRVRKNYNKGAKFEGAKVFGPLNHPLSPEG